MLLLLYASLAQRRHTVRLGSCAPPSFGDQQKFTKCVGSAYTYLAGQSGPFVLPPEAGIVIGDNVDGGELRCQPAPLRQCHAHKAEEHVSSNARSLSLHAEGPNDRHLILEIHYDNPTHITGKHDKSGLRIWREHMPRKYAAGLIVLGDPCALHAAKNSNTQPHAAMHSNAPQATIDAVTIAW